MLKKILCAALMWPLLALAQSYPSPTYQNLTVLGTFTGNIGPGSLAAQAANTVVANVTASSASPAAVALPSCSTANSALKYTSGTGFVCGTTYGLTSGTLAQFAATTSAQLAGVISDESGSGPLVFATGAAINPASTGATTPGTGAFTSLSATGGTYTGAVSISFSNPFVIVNDTSGTNSASTYFRNNGTNVWQLSNASTSNGFGISRYVAGTLTDIPISISNSTGSVTFADQIVPNQTAGILGTTTNNNANAGAVGEFPTPTNLSSVSLTANTPANVSSVSLTAGDWDVSCTAQFVAAGSTTIANESVGVSSTSATFGGLGSTFGIAVSLTTGSTNTFQSPVTRFSLTSTTTVYCVASSGFGTSTMTANGFLRARRVR